jgi:L-iditol 2-dehydrogenase
MRAAVLRPDGRVVAEDWPRPAAGPGELLLRLRGCGLCGSDIAKVVGGAAPAPRVLGHELVGDVVEADAACPFGPGDRVVAAHHVPCGACHYCRRGSESMCRAFKTSNLDPGGFAEYVRIPAANVRHATFRIPAHVGDEAASFVEPLACCLRAVRRAGIAPGDTVAVLGLGSIGCLFLQLARRAGAAAVGVDLDPARRARAGRFAAAAGAPAAAGPAIRARAEGRGADHVIVTAGGAEGVAWAVGALRDGGAAHVFAGGAGHGLPVRLAELYHRELTIATTYSSSPRDLADAFAAIAGGEVDVADLYTHRLPLERVGEGVDLMRRREALKVYVTP